MSRVLQAVDSIHQVGVFCLALVPPNYLPKVGLICELVISPCLLEGGLFFSHTFLTGDPV